MESKAGFFSWLTYLPTSEGLSQYHDSLKLGFRTEARTVGFSIFCIHVGKQTFMGPKKKVSYFQL